MTKVLVVDDDKDMCQVISSILKEEGYSVAIAHDGKAALEKIRRQRYDVIILDYKLSGMSGLTMLEKSRRIRPSIKTIMISALGDSSAKARAQELGACGFLDKPFDIRRFVRIVKNALAEKKRPGRG